MLTEECSNSRGLGVLTGELRFQCSRGDDQRGQRFQSRRGIGQRGLLGCGADGPRLLKVVSVTGTPGIPYWRRYLLWQNTISVSGCCDMENLRQLGVMMLRDHQTGSPIQDPGPPQGNLGTQDSEGLPDWV